jgi:hypothetical protein
MNHEESQLLVGMNAQQRRRRLPFLGDGAVSKVGIFVRLAGGVSGPTGWRSTPRDGSSSAMPARQRVGVHQVRRAGLPHPRLHRRRP